MSNCFHGPLVVFVSIGVLKFKNFHWRGFDSFLVYRKKFLIQNCYTMASISAVSRLNPFQVMIQRCHSIERHHLQVLRGLIGTKTRRVWPEWRPQSNSQKKALKRRGSQRASPTRASSSWHCHNCLSGGLIYAGLGAFDDRNRICYATFEKRHPWLLQPYFEAPKCY